MERPGFLNAYFMLGKNVFLYVTKILFSKGRLIVICWFIKTNNRKTI